MFRRALNWRPFRRKYPPFTLNCGDKKKKMISLFIKQKGPPPSLLTLPTYCVPAKSSEDLALKREAQLKWMQDRGMRYLGDPSKPSEKRPRQQSSASSAATVRFVSLRNHRSDAA
jgi:hypothetical protein